MSSFQTFLSSTERTFADDRIKSWRFFHRFSGKCFASLPIYDKMFSWNDYVADKTKTWWKYCFAHVKALFVRTNGGKSVQKPKVSHSIPDCRAKQLIVNYKCWRKRLETWTYTISSPAQSGRVVFRALAFFNLTGLRNFPMHHSHLFK